MGQQKDIKEQEGEVHLHGNAQLSGAKERMEPRTGAKIVSDLDDMSDDEDEDEEAHVENGFGPTERSGRQAAKGRDALPIIIPKFVPSSARGGRDGAQLGKQQV